MIKGTGQQVPEWREAPELVRINVKILGEDSAGKILAEFVVGGQIYVASVDKELIDQDQNNMTALIVADVGIDYLVDLPGDSLSAGSRILFGPEDLQTS